MVLYNFSSGVCLMGTAWLAMVVCISYSLCNRNSVMVMGDFVQACRLSLGRCSEPPYLADINLANPW